MSIVTTTTSITNTICTTTDIMDTIIMATITTNELEAITITSMNTRNLSPCLTAENLSLFLSHHTAEIAKAKQKIRSKKSDPTCGEEWLKLTPSSKHVSLLCRKNWTRSPKSCSRSKTSRSASTPNSTNSKPT